MVKKKPGEMTNEELVQEAKSVKSATWVLTVMLLVLFFYSLYRTVKDGQIQIAMVIPIALLPVVYNGFRKIRKIESEIEQRGRL